MGRLLDIYETQIKTAEVEEQEEQQAEILQKYAEFAETQLQELGQEYTEEDVIKVASFALENDMAAAEAEEKIAAFEEAGRSLARSFVAEFETSEDE